MRVLFFSDLHAHFWSFGGINEHGLSRKFVDQLNVLSQIKGIVFDTNIKTVVFGGDLFHSVSNISVEVINNVVNFFEELRNSGVEVIITTGNHDLVKRANPSWFHDVTKAFFDPNAQHDWLKVINYQDEVDYSSIKGFEVVMAHKTPAGSKVGSYIFDEGVDWKKLAAQNKLVLFGHIHQPQQLADNCFVLGAPLQLNFGDFGDRGVYILDRSTSKFEFIPLQSPKYVTVTNKSEVKQDGNYYRVYGQQIESLDNVLSLKDNTVKERIKSEDFTGVLREWLQMNGQDESKLDLIKKYLSKGQEHVRALDVKLVRLHAKDFLSLGEVDFQFMAGLNLVTGVNDFGGSNGSGKTSLFEAVYYCLFGETTKGLTGDSVVRRGEKDCLVRLVLSCGQDNYTVTRSRKGLLIDKNGVSLTEGLRFSDANNYLVQLFGVDKMVFRSSCYFSQENLVNLTGFSDTEKTNIICDLLGFGFYDSLYEDISKEIEQVQKRQEALISEKNKLCNEKIIKEGEVGSLTNSIQWISPQRKTLLDSVEKTKKDKEALQISLSSIQVSSGGFDDRLSSLDDLERELSESIKVARSSISSRVQDVNVIRDRSFSIRQKIHEYSVMKNSLDNKIKETNKSIERLCSLEPGTVCPVCAGKVDKSNVESCVLELRKSIAVLEGQKESIDPAIQEQEKTNGLLLVEVSSLEEQKSSLEKEVQKLEEDKNNVFRKRQVILDESKKSLLEKQRLELEIKNLNTHERSLEKQLSDLLRLESETEEKIKKATEGIAVLNSNLVSVEENLSSILHSVEGLSFWKKSFSSSGIKPLLLDRFCNQFNNLVNSYLSRASGGRMSVSITPTKTLKSGEERNKLGLSIQFSGEEVAYESLSGGEKRRVDISTCFAMNRWVAQRFSLSTGLFGFMVFDEVFSFMDVDGEESVAGILLEEGRDKALYVITHMPELPDYTDRVIYLSKRDGVTELLGSGVKNNPLQEE